MISFFINFYRFCKLVFIGIKKDTEFRYLFFFLSLLLTSSTIFYHKIEHWELIDSLYFSVMTMATVGYGDFVPTHNISKIFTIIYTFLSIGTFVAFTAKIVQFTLQKDNRKTPLHKLTSKFKNKNP
ncbi:potassium channel family protein [Tenacibaculum singaporense]|uniref:potassium channel family protein n=1 Tax=Tenacibaculum singaporense TaxID=2358479 RepID=UPI000F680045|nr:two pore domain potassium channel family protein [Tenacibaculum singaporense]